MVDKATLDLMRYDIRWIWVNLRYIGLLDIIHPSYVSDVKWWTWQKWVESAKLHEICQHKQVFIFERHHSPCN